MKNTNTAAAIALALGLVISSCILSFTVGSLGKSIERASSYARPQPIRIPKQIELELSTRNLAPLILRVENSPVGASLKIETSDKDK